MRFDRTYASMRLFAVAVLAAGTCAAAPRILSLVGRPGDAPSAEAAQAYEEDIRPEDVPVLAAAVRWSEAAEKRRKLWERYLSLMELEECKPSDSDRRFSLAAGGRIYSFTGSGRIFPDDRFVADDEMDSVEALERLFAAQHSRSPFAKTHPLCSPEATATSFPSSRAGAAALRVPVFAGYADSLFQKHDALAARLADEFAASPASFAGISAAAAETVHQLPPALVKSFLLEDRYGDWDAVDEASARAALVRLVKAGFHEPDGRFSGWNIALRRYEGASTHAGDGRSFRNAFAERVISRARDPERFVPVTWRRKHQK